MAIRAKITKIKKKKILPHISGNIEQYEAVGPFSKDSEYDKNLYYKTILAWKIISERNFLLPLFDQKKSIAAPIMYFKSSAWKDTAAINSIFNRK